MAPSELVNQPTKDVMSRTLGQLGSSTMPATSATTTNHYVINSLNILGTPNSCANQQPGPDAKVLHISKGL